ncbi:MAG: ATP-dependent sacrificial sulfur transferase LarE [Methanomassiliicoccus sp.]|nr:MAG: ATP-dependent sacrificial sulfur transferase LarE [Methanomassiliicoccus sp.]
MNVNHVRLKINNVAWLVLLKRMNEANEKYQQMVNSIGGMGKVAVAFSGGADSTLLLKAALDSRAEVTTFMAVGEIFFLEEQKKALALAEELGVKVTLIKTDLLNDERFKRNWEDRCYICKSTIFQLIKKACLDREITNILDGSQMDDLKEVRPGRAALVELNVRSPLVDVKLNKEEVRSLLKEMGISNWDAPGNTCLATRVPYDVRITWEQLKRVKKAEALLAPYNFKQLRVRDHGNWARIEVAPEEIPRLFSERGKVVELLRPLGYRRVSMDMEGYGH